LFAFPAVTILAHPAPERSAPDAVETWVTGDLLALHPRGAGAVEAIAGRAGELVYFTPLGTMTKSRFGIATLDDGETGHPRFRLQPAGRWTDVVLQCALLPWVDEGEVQSLMGKTYLIVGFGDIGQQFARLVRPFNAKILAVRRGEAFSPLADETHALSRLDELLPRADVVLLSLPNSPETAGLTGASGSGLRCGAAVAATSLTACSPTEKRISETIFSPS
jgi:hypothetical protein